MKTPFKLIFAVLVPAMLFVQPSHAQKHTKQKTIKKAYLVNADAGVDIDNAYGNVYVTTWNEDKIELDILIKVSGDKEDWTLRKLNDIDVDITALKTLVTAKTTFANGAGKNVRNSSIEVNYTVKIPTNGSVTVDNRYGQVITTDLFGATNIRCRYGKIVLGKLNAVSNQIRIEYCTKSTIDYVKHAQISADYSGITMNDFSNITLKADYTDINFRNGDNLKYSCNYGNLKFGKLGNLDGAGNYLTIQADEISGNLKVDTKYSKLTIAELTPKAGNAIVNTEYTQVNLGYHPQYAFDFDVKVRYGNLHAGDLEINNKSETPTSKNYSGYYKKSGVNKLAVTSGYGNINLHKNH